MRVIGALLVIAFSLAAFLHFVGRIFRNRASGRSRASAVSLALAFLALGPVVTTGLTRGIIPPRHYGAVELLAVVLSAFLVIAITRVEQQEEQRKAVKKSRAEAEELLAQVRKPPTRPRR